MNSEGGGCLALIAIIVIIVTLIGSCSNMVTEEKAMARFVEITGTNDIVIIRHSNMSPIFGDPHDVTFELMINGKYVAARCTSDTFSPMVCRIYTGDE